MRDVKYVNSNGRLLHELNALDSDLEKLLKLTFLKFEDAVLLFDFILLDQNDLL